MLQQTDNIPLQAARPRIGKMPVPHEHGAWVMLYLPSVAAFTVAGAAAWQWAALLAAVTGLFMAREAVGLLIRKRAKPGTAFWLGLYLLVAAAGATPLLSGQGGAELLMIGVIAAALFASHSVLLIIPARKRLDRSVWGELLGVAGLTLTGPAAWAVSRGELDGAAWTLWALSAAYFGGGIFYVKMWLEAAKARGWWTHARKGDLGRDNLMYHAALSSVLLFVAGTGFPGSSLLLLGFAPAIFRAFYGWSKLSPKLPNLKKVGVLETVIAVWFGVFLVLALR